LIRKCVAAKGQAVGTWVEIFRRAAPYFGRHREVDHYAVAYTPANARLILEAFFLPGRPDRSALLPLLALFSVYNPQACNRNHLRFLINTVDIYSEHDRTTFGILIRYFGAARQADLSAELLHLFLEKNIAAFFERQKPVSSYHMRDWIREVFEHFKRTNASSIGEANRADFAALTLAIALEQLPLPGREWKENYREVVEALRSESQRRGEANGQGNSRAG
jgi:hypothetical protein